MSPDSRSTPQVIARAIKNAEDRKLRNRKLAYDRARRKRKEGS